MDEEIFDALQHAIQESKSRLDEYISEQESKIYLALGIRYYEIVTNRYLRANHKKELLGDLQEDARIYQRSLQTGDHFAQKEQNVIRILSELQPLMDKVEDGYDDQVEEGDDPREAKPVPPKWRSFKNNQ